MIPPIRGGWIGVLLYYALPIRRHVIRSNLARVYGTTLSPKQIRRLAQAHYAHLARLIREFITFPWLSAERRKHAVRVENIDAVLAAHALGKGVLLLAAHLGNWEVAIAAGLEAFEQYRGQFHVVRRPLFPAWLDRLVTRRLRRAGFGVLPKKGSLDTILQRLAAGDAVIFVFDQHAGGRDGIRVDFFGHPAGTFRSLAVLALATGAPVVPAATWRNSAGTHVLRFEERLPLLDDDDHDTAIHRNTRAYNAALERLIAAHPEQWFWMHRRWKV